ncbi:PAS domain-containing hybrid sensor histidine kinase/response regulator [Litorilituus lipolyticus]|uniref:Sensory/regulatory protein RpfC n=1 Tax=Litorilituus lipolyticus TaxID=2491017 RepID=A0A502KU64_9GAMM|nr:response regulator [Litorilituus lipolyticus]TPH13949.1 PAS domain-containing sensor histidine kinase [Litorilituus lipolyticus]
MSNNTLKKFGKSKLFYRWIVFLNVIIVCLALLLAYWAVEQNYQSTQKNWQSNLSTIRATTQEVLDIWGSNQKQKIKSIASDPKIHQLAQDQLGLYMAGRDITNSFELHELRKIFKRLQDVSQHKGFFLIAPDGTNIGSMRDSNLALKNLVYLTRNENFKQALKGETVFVLPMVSDVIIANTPNISGQNFPSTMFILTPLIVDGGNVVGVLAERLDPLGEFSKILTLGRIGDSGETYVVNTHGKMISDSRFSKQLTALNMIQPVSQSILSIDIKDPQTHKLTHAAQQALNKKTGSNVQGYIDYRGVEVIGSWAWSDNIQAAVITEVDKVEGYQSFSIARFTILLILSVLVLVSIGISLFIVAMSNKANKVLAKANNSLEARVKQRTQQLEFSQEQVIENERKLQIVLDNISALIYLKDLQGVYLLVNKEWETTLGLKTEDVVGKTDLQIFPEEIAQSFISTDQEAIQNVNTVQIENIAPDTLGNIKTYWTSKIPIIGETGQVTGVLGVSVDITARKTMEAELINAKELAEQANVAKGEFLASMSHEIRTPMNGILGMLGLVIDSELNQNQRKKLEIAQDSANSLLTILNDILDFSKIEAGKIEIEQVDFDLRELFEKIIRSFAFRAEDKQIELVLDLSKVKQSRIKSDPTRLRQIVTNLLGNAIKFTNTGEVVCKVSLSSVNNNALILEVAIKDTGIGIPQEKLTQLFESFSQVDSSTTRKYGGTGLGLAICKRLSTLLGGDIHVESDYKVGSCFTINIPVQESESKKHYLPYLDMNNLSVLVVDDNNTNRMVFAEQLAAWGATVIHAVDAKDALDIIRQYGQQINLALVDMHMPKMDGLTLCRKIRAEQENNHIKLILMTSLSEVEDKSNLVNIGINGFFTKPVTTSDLLDGLSVVVNEGNDILNEGQLVTSSFLNSYDHHVDEDKTNINGNANEKVVKGTKKANILVVEDNRVNQMVLKGVLAKLGLTCEIAQHGIDALDKLNAYPNKYYDLIIMDCQMPEMDGYQATQAIRQGEAGAHNMGINIVALTAHAMATDKEKCISAGMNDYLRKPVEKEALIEVLNKYRISTG